MSKPEEPTAMASWMRGLGTLLEKEGHDPVALFRKAGLDYAATRQPEARFLVSNTTRVWQLAVELTKDETIGLKAIRYITPTTFSVVGMSVLASQSLRDAFSRLTRFADLITDASELKLECVNDQQTALTIELRSQIEPAHQSTDGLLALLANSGKALGNEIARPVCVDLLRPQPLTTNLEFFYKTFACPLHFQQSRLRLVFRDSDLDEPLVGANSLIADHLDEVSKNAIEQLKPANSTKTKLTRWIEHELQKGRPVSIEQAALHCHMSTRNLQRKLAEEGSSFNQLLDDNRRKIAHQKLTKTTAPLTGIALELGFSDSSSFSRACKRWFGQSPSQVRN